MYWPECDENSQKKAEKQNYLIMIKNPLIKLQIKQQKL